jgi:hypothetical protein
MDLIGLLEQGLPVSTVQTPRTRMGLTEEEILALIAPCLSCARKRIRRSALHASMRAPRRCLVSRSSRPHGCGQRSPHWLVECQCRLTAAGAHVVEEMLLGIDDGQLA